MLFIKIKDENGFGDYVPATSIKKLRDWANGKSVEYIDVDGKLQHVEVKKFDFIEFNGN